LPCTASALLAEAAGELEQARLALRRGRRTVATLGRPPPRVAQVLLDKGPLGLGRSIAATMPRGASRS